MRSRSIVISPELSSSFLRRVAAVVGLSGLIGLAAACSGSPTSPSVFSAERRVETGSGGGSTSPTCSATDVCGRVSVSAAGGTLSGTSIVDTTSPGVFAFTAPLTGTGRFTDGFISADVNGGTAVIYELTYGRSNGTFGETSVSVPAVTTVTPGGCADGRALVETRITATLQNLGPTAIVESHCYLAAI
jgi:hypothetical protein